MCNKICVFASGLKERSNNVCEYPFSCLVNPQKQNTHFPTKLLVIFTKLNPKESNWEVKVVGEKQNKKKLRKHIPNELLNPSCSWGDQNQYM